MTNQDELTPKWKWTATMYHKKEERYVGSFDVLLDRPNADRRIVEAIAITQIPATWRGKVEIDLMWMAN